MTLDRATQLMGRYLLLLFIACVFIFPIIFMIVSSFKPDLQLLQDTSSIRALLPVGDISLNNYREAFARAPIGLFIFNSVFITATTLLLSLFLASIAAFKNEHVVAGLPVIALALESRSHQGGFTAVADSNEV